MIKIQVIGRLGKDAVVKNINGATVINFSVAHSKKYKNKEGVAMEETIWVECAYWTDRTAVAPYLLKGTQVFVEGEPSADFYNAGAAGLVASQKCRVQNIQLLGNVKDNQGGQQQQRSNAQQGGNNNYPSPNEITEPVDDLPF